MSTGPVLQSNWDWRAAGNFIGGGSGSGLLIITAAMTQTGATNYALVLTAALLIMTGLGLVWLEIGRPLRFLNVYRNPGTSWMSRESYLATLLVPLALTSFWLQSESLLLWSALIAALFLYSQARILKAARSIAAWRTAKIVPLIITTGLVEGLGILLMLWVFLSALKMHIHLIEISIVSWTLLITRLWSWYDYHEILKNNVPEQTFKQLDQFHTRFIIFGHVLPATLVIIAMIFTSLHVLLVLLTGLCLTLSGWVIKYVIITRAAYNEGYAIVHSPARGAGEPGPGCKPGWIASEK